MIAEIAIGAGALLLGYSIFIEPRLLSHTKLTLTPPNMPDELDGFTAHIVSDLHSTQYADMEKRVRKILLDNPADAVFVLGDMIMRNSSLDFAMRVLEDIPTRQGVFIVLGNAENKGYVETQEIIAKLKATKHRLLLNENAVLSYNGVGFELIGVNDPHTGNSDLAKALVTPTPALHASGEGDIMKSASGEGDKKSPYSSSSNSPFEGGEGGCDSNEESKIKNEELQKENQDKKSSYESSSNSPFEGGEGGCDSNEELKIKNEELQKENQDKKSSYESSSNSPFEGGERSSGDDKFNQTVGCDSGSKSMVSSADAPQPMHPNYPRLFRVLLAHSPKIFIDPKVSEVDLAFCGHTHGGQVRIPFVGPTMGHDLLEYRLSAGLVQPQRLMKMFGHSSAPLAYISRGIGTGYIHTRLLCMPEIITVTFTKKACRWM